MLLSRPQMSQGASRSANYRQRLVFIDDSDDCHYNQIKAQTTAFALPSMCFFFLVIVLIFEKGKRLQMSCSRQCHDDYFNRKH
ncbi:hypothetical protein NPIL_397831 [Nephila pilipes]|uniref:Uncharacterized protein n=1 Tax=Nephila pilipes TaxID=299642 RepID=A0A8X6N6B7_NEPPI|nr:hypothetical protein NPIL_397831 [Nephila pilipes]